MTRRRKVFVVCAIVVAVPVMVLGGLQLLFPLHRDPPQVIGEEMGAGGQFTRRIVYEGSYRVTGWQPGPTGGRQKRIKYSEFFLEEPGGRQKLPFLESVLPGNEIGPDLCVAVEGTSLWVAAGFFNAGPQIEVIVFDNIGVRTKRTIVVAVDEWHPGHDFWFEKGNALLRFRSPGGVGTYDVVWDTETR